MVSNGVFSPRKKLCKGKMCSLLARKGHWAGETDKLVTRDFPLVVLSAEN